MADLKPCPFCGCAAEMETSFYTTGMFENHYRYPKCSGCDAAIDNHYLSEEALVAQWNSRVDGGHVDG